MWKCVPLKIQHYFGCIRKKQFPPVSIVCGGMSSFHFIAFLPPLSSPGFAYSFSLSRRPCCFHCESQINISREGERDEQSVAGCSPPLLLSLCLLCFPFFGEVKYKKYANVLGRYAKNGVYNKPHFFTCFSTKSQKLM